MDVVKYDIADAAISEMSSRYMALVVKDEKDEAGFKAVHNARIIVKGKRCEVEKKRIELKAEALKYGRDVDAEAKRITALLAPIEQHLDTQEAIVTEAKAKREREAAEAAEAKRLADEKAVKDAEEARIKAERDAERAKLEADRKAFEEQQRKEREEWAKARTEMEATAEAGRKAMADERAKIEAAQKVERDRLAAIAAAQKAEADSLAAEKESIRRAAELEQAKKDAAEHARLQAEREAAEAKQREEEARQKAEAERARVDAMRPDVEKINRFGATIRRLDTPAVSSQKASAFITSVNIRLAKIAAECEQFNAKEA